MDATSLIANIITSVVTLIVAWLGVRYQQKINARKVAAESAEFKQAQRLEWTRLQKEIGDELWENAQEELCRLRDELERNRAELKLTNTALIDLRAQLRHTNNELDKTKQELERTNAELREVRAENAQLLAERREYVAEIASLTRRIRELEALTGSGPLKNK